MNEIKEAIDINVMKATVIIRETEITDNNIVRDIEVDVDEELDEMITLVFTYVF